MRNFKVLQTEYQNLSLHQKSFKNLGYKVNYILNFAIYLFI